MQVKKNLIFILLFIFGLISCEPSYRIYVRNSSASDLYIKTHPSIESDYESNPFFKSAPQFYPNYNSVIACKFKQEGEYSIYKVKPYDSLNILGDIGFGPVIEQLPFDYIALINGSDSTVLDSKEKIIGQAKLMGKRRKRNYYIEIKK
jgi:hypothetical protein